MDFEGENPSLGRVAVQQPKLAQGATSQNQIETGALASVFLWHSAGMASSKNTVEYVTGQMRLAGTISARAMFGEYGIYCDGKIVALVCDDQLFVKPTGPGRVFAEPIDEAPPYPGAKMWFRINADKIEDADWLSALIRMTWMALPVQKVKVARKKK
jgi:TfoX/Sxy family transcriptional regulator of competence genes